MKFNEKLNDFLKQFSDLIKPQSNDILFYNLIAETLAEYTDLKQEHILNSLVHLCDKDEDLIKKFEIDEQTHLILQKLLIKMMFEFTKQNKTEWFCKIEIYAKMPNGKVHKISIEKQYDWVDIPGTIRDIALRKNQDHIRGTLYNSHISKKGE